MMSASRLKTIAGWLFVGLATLVVVIMTGLVATEGDTESAAELALGALLVLGVGAGLVVTRHLRGPR